MIVQLGLGRASGAIETIEITDVCQNAQVIETNHMPECWHSLLLSPIPSGDGLDEVDWLIQLLFVVALGWSFSC